MDILICHLTKKLEPILMEGFDSIFTDMNENMEGFKKGLKGLSELNDERLVQEALRIETKFPVIRRLLHAIGVSIRKKYNWSVDEGPKLPELKDFIHNCYIECADVISQFDSWDTKQSTTRKLAIDTVKDTIKSEALTMFSVEELIKKTTMDVSRSSRRSTRKKFRKDRGRSRSRFGNTSDSERRQPISNKVSKSKSYSGSDSDTFVAPKRDSRTVDSIHRRNRFGSSQHTSIASAKHSGGYQPNSGNSITLSDDNNNSSDTENHSIKSLPLGLILNDKKGHIEKLSMPSESVDVQGLFEHGKVAEKFGNFQKKNI